MTCYLTSMRIKRTYNLRADTVAAVRELVEERRLAPSQDALVEMALEDFFMAVRHADEARQFAEAVRDPEIAREITALEREFQTADREIWPE